MLILTAKRGERITIDHGSVKIKFHSLKQNKVYLQFSGTKQFTIRTTKFQKTYKNKYILLYGYVGDRFIIPEIQTTVVISRLISYQVKFGFIAPRHIHILRSSLQLT